MTTPEARYSRYQALQRYVGWSDEDAHLVWSYARPLDAHLGPLVDDFYAELDRHHEARKVITAGPAQIARLKGSLVGWLRGLLSGPYDSAYVEGRLRVGWRHVEIGLDQVYTNVAMSRLRAGLVGALGEVGPADRTGFVAAVRSLNKLLDLDLALIEDAYQTEHLARRERDGRLAAIGQMGGGVAHELRNPLNVIRTSVYFLLNARDPSPEKRHEHLRRIDEQVSHSDRIITALSNYAKMPVPAMRPLDLRRCAEEAAAERPPPAGVRLAFDWPKALTPALADPDQLRIVLSNLIRNAVDAMPGGGSLTLSARQEGPHVELSVTDTGVGIASDQLTRIMEPLYTTKAKGLGLGLALARAILDKNRGALRVASVPREGTTFTVRLTAAPTEE